MRTILTIICTLSLFSSATAENKLNAITTIDEYGYFVETYYLHPEPKLINSAITYIGSSDHASDKNMKAGLLMSFSCLFSMYDHDYKEKWIQTINSIKDPEKSLLTKSVNSSPSELLKQTPLSAAKNDMNWACFFITGDSKYLNNIIQTLKYLDNRKDINLYLTAASAKWSLSSNARYHPKVKAEIEILKKDNKSPIQSIANDILIQSPQQVRQETIAVLKDQKSKGVW